MVDRSIVEDEDKKQHSGWWRNFYSLKPHVMCGIADINETLGINNATPALQNSQGIRHKIGKQHNARQRGEYPRTLDLIEPTAVNTYHPLSL